MTRELSSKHYSEIIERQKITNKEIIRRRSLAVEVVRECGRRRQRADSCIVARVQLRTTKGITDLLSLRSSFDWDADSPRKKPHEEERRHGT